MTSKLWKPRASGIGNYMKCLWRAANDRFAEERPGEGWTKEEQEDTTYADHGTCCHFTLQDGTRSIFDPREPTEEEVNDVMINFLPSEHAGKDEAFMAKLRWDVVNAFRTGDPRAFAPTPKEWHSASQLFGGHAQIHRDAVRKIATYAAERMPRSPDGKPWVSEASWESDCLTGHTDFTSQCMSMGGDLKSTARPPEGGEVKDEHLAQLAGYYNMTGIPLWWVLYVDSKNAAWSTLVWVDFRDPARQFYAEQVDSFCRMLMSPLLEQVAYPQVSSHCRKSWCGYTKACSEKIRPRPGAFHDAIAAKRLVGRIRSPFDPLP